MIQGTHNALDDPRNETVKIFINGELIARKDAKISVFDSGYLVGDGVWEALRLHKGVLVFLDLHLKRLWQTAISAHYQLIEAAGGVVVNSKREVLWILRNGKWDVP